MSALLFLAHRIPYPPNKGDKIRSWNILRHLSRRMPVRLAAFVDDPADWQHAESLRRWCDEVRLFPLHPGRARVRSLLGLGTGAPLSVVYFQRRALGRWVERQVFEQGVDQAFVFSSTMAQYLLGGRFAGVRRVVDMVDVDSEKFRHYAEHHSGPLARLYAREARRLLGFERRVAAEFAESLFVSESEAALFRGLAPESADRVCHMTNGVDAGYFAPHHALDNPYGPDEKALVFTGAMDYAANIDAVKWFCDQVWPRLRRQVPACRFHIVGARPAEAVRRLAEREGVSVSGAVDDVRPYLAHAVAAVAPLRIARGLQNKVLEAMAMAKPVVATPAAMEGIVTADGLEALVEATPEGFASRLGSLLEQGDRGHWGARAREFVLRHHAWDAHLLELDRLLEPAGPRPAAPHVGAVA